MSEPIHATQATAATLPCVVDIHDRVADAYYGKMGARFMHETQERIHWICAQVKGETVLDVGCSQGITSILLGREGKRVQAIDSDDRSIDEARTLLASEPEPVQAKVEFLHTDFLAIPSKDKRYDTVVISEVLEHLVNPSAFVEAAALCLKPGGTLVVTVPFGINDFVDHKRTYYLLEPFELLSSAFEVVEVSVMGKWLGLSGRLRAPGQMVNKPAGALSNELVERLEKAFHKLEQELRRESGEFRNRLHEANLKYRSVTEQVSNLKQQLAQEEQTRKRVQVELGLLKSQQQQTSASAQRLQTQCNELTAQVRSLQTGLTERDNALASLSHELILATERVELTHGSRSSEVQSLQTALDAASAERREMERSMVRAQTERDLIVRSAGTLEDQLRQARQQREDSLVIAARLEEQHKVLAQRLAEHERLKAELHEAHEVGAQLRQQTEQAQAAQSEAAAQAATLHAELAGLRALQLRLHSERDNELALHRSHSHQAEQVKLQLLHALQARDELRSQLDRAQQDKLAAEDRVARTRAMVSFRLGYSLLHGFGSFAALRLLPSQLWQLYREAGRRRGIREHEETDSALRLPAPGSVDPARPATPAKPLLLDAHQSPGERSLGEVLKGLKVACIMDEFTFSSYAPECKLLPLSVDQWQAELEAFVPELLFIESAWRGKDDRWGSKVGHLSSEVSDILAWCRSRQIPTVFWNKEDPIHFETFLTTARLFDHIFTTDIDCIHRYKSALGHDRVHLLPFACQPTASNPIETCERKDAFCFAGAYYVRYPERTRDLGHFMVHLAQHRPVEIYDRNFGKNDPNYQFPSDYQPFIVGTLPFDQIDRAYKGYRYAINLNSIKQSQSMFARRVFELLASNTITISNYSRGLRLLFGDLVVTTDNGQEIVKRLRKLGHNPSDEGRFRLAALRKVMRDHTYQDRLAYVVSKVQGGEVDHRRGLLPTVTMTGYARDQVQLDALLASFHRQTHHERRLLVVTSSQFVPASAPPDARVQLLGAREIAGCTLRELALSTPWLAGVVPEDHHGPNYLLDLVLATRYSRAVAIGKASHCIWSAQGGVSMASPENQYRPARRLLARCAIVSTAHCDDIELREWVTSLHTRALELPDMLGVDGFNYCRNGAEAPEVAAAVDDLCGLDTGLEMAALIEKAEAVEAAEAAVDTDPVLTGAELAAHFKPVVGKPYELGVEGSGWNVTSQLGDGKHEYLYAANDMAPSALGAGQQLRFHLDCTPGLNLQLTVLFLDAHKQRISHVVKPANRNQEAPVPPGTVWVRLGLRLYGSGETRINSLVLGHRPLRPATVLGRAEHLLVTNHYPSYGDLYRNGFVHSRVSAYRDRGVGVDVFRLRKDEAMSYHEYQDVDVLTGSQEALNLLLSSGIHKSVLVHFLDPAMWAVLKRHIHRVKVVVWVHGSEIQPWHRRAFNCENEAELNAAKAQSEPRMAFWRALLQSPPANLHMVFVSRYFAEEVMQDLGFRLPEHAYSIIHNPINTEVFNHQPKGPEQRRKILSIRPFASHQYANDLSVAALLELSTTDCFKDLDIRIVGDGKLFEETVKPLRGFSNVSLEKRFLTASEIAQLHKEYGVFLCPTRWDSHGVSRDEAMSSGLVPITNDVAAIPEFVDDSCGYKAPRDDFRQLASALLELIHDAELFKAKSKKAADSVRQQSALHTVIPLELGLFVGESSS